MAPSPTFLKGGGRRPRKDLQKLGLMLEPSSFLKGVQANKSQHHPTFQEASKSTRPWNGSRPWVERLSALWPTESQLLQGEEDTKTCQCYTTTTRPYPIGGYGLPCHRTRPLHCPPREASTSHTPGSASAVDGSEIGVNRRGLYHRAQPSSPPPRRGGGARGSSEISPCDAHPSFGGGDFPTTDWPDDCTRVASAATRVTIARRCGQATSA